MINPINKKDNKCFQYAETVALKQEEIIKKTHTITKVKPFINKYDWEGIKLHQKKMTEKKNEKNNVTIALNAFYI